MGWKNVKEHYRVGHNVKVEECGICIGTGLSSALIVINQDGLISKRYDGQNADLNRYQNEMDANPAKLIELVTSPDQFGPLTTVYTYTDEGIVEKSCEVLGWPNVTTDGEVMYENTFSTDRDAIVAKAIRSCELAIEMNNDLIRRTEADLLRFRARVSYHEGIRAQLITDNPHLNQSEPAKPSEDPQD